jgi:DNA-binding transcriptional MerR regulator
MDLVAEAKKRLDALPPPKNGQVRAVPDDRTVRYYAAKGLLDRPAAMRGRTALYGPRHLAQIVAIKRMQSAGHSLADIEQMWSELDDSTLSRISGVALATGGKRVARKDFWKQSPDPTPTIPHVTRPVPSRGIQPTELRVEVAPGVSVVVALPAERSISISPADVHAVRVAAAAVVTELANRGLIARGTGTLEEEP